MGDAFLTAVDITDANKEIDNLSIDAESKERRLRREARARAKQEKEQRDKEVLSNGMSGDNTRDGTKQDRTV